MKNKFFASFVVASVLATFPLFAFAQSWSDPQDIPPNANTPTPFNVSSDFQDKAGPAEIDGNLALFGNLLLPSWTGIGVDTVEPLAGAVTADQFCLTGSGPDQGTGCISSWPTGGGSGGGFWALVPNQTTTADIQYNSGNVKTSDSVYAQAFYYQSDENLKKNIATLPDALDNVLKLRGVSFDWKSSGAPSMGVIAQEVEQVYPALVSTDPTTGIKSVNYAGLTGALIEAIKTQQTEINTLQSEVDALKKP